MQYEWLFLQPLQNLPYLLGGAARSLQLAIVATIGGLIIAVTANWVRQIDRRALSALISAYVEVARNTPVLVQLFLAYFGLPSVGINMDAATTAAVVFTLNNGAYLTEILRGGMAGVPYGQVETGLSLGMTRYQVFRYVTLPQAIRNAAPALANQFIALTLATSLASQIAAEELTYRATLLEARIFHSFEIYIIVLVIYFVLAQAMMRAMNWLNRSVLHQSPTYNIPQL